MGFMDPVTVPGTQEQVCPDHGFEHRAKDKGEEEADIAA